MSIDRGPLLLTAGFLALYLPSYFGLSQRVWTESEEMHGPIVLAVAAWALWNLREPLRQALGQSHRMGWPVLIAGLVFFFVGRVLDILVLEIGSQVVVLAGLLLLLGGFAALRLALFPLVFLLFMVPLPSTLIDSLTGSLKQVVSVVAESILYWAGYPVARSGVVISVGPYQLMVADACSGLKSMFSLTSMGLLYIYLVGHKSWVRNGVLIAALLPIAFLANVARVMILILITYHLGDEAGQGFAHDAAGIVLFVLAILFLSAFDSLIGIVAKRLAR